MKRREFIAGTAALVVSQRSLRAQGAPRRIGFLGPLVGQPVRDAWTSGLREKGWIEGKNLLVEYRYEPHRDDRFPDLAAELVALVPDLVVVSGPQAAAGMKSATATIPIVFVAVADPVQAGFVQSLSRPGGNMTGLATLVPGEFFGKQIEILRELLPGSSKIAFLVNPNNVMHRVLIADEIPRHAHSLGVALLTIQATKPEDLDIAFSTAAAQHADAIVVLGDYLTIFHAPQIIALAAKYHLPAIHLFRLFADGALVVYGPALPDLWRRAGGYVDRILKGAKPSDLPVEQPTKFELVINMKTAKGAWPLCAALVARPR